MAVRKVIWSRTAYLQRKSILFFWVERNKSNTYSLKLLKQTKLATQQLAKLPFIGKNTDIENIRVYVMGNYKIYYSFTETEIQVVCF